MFDLEDTHREGRFATDWQSVAQEALDGQAKAIARALAEGDLPDRLLVAKAKLSDRSMTLVLDVGGRLAIMKVFDPENPDSDIAYQREKTALLALKGKEVVPPIVAFSDERRFVITNFVAHLKQSHVEELYGRDGLVREIGCWLARMDRIAPSQPAPGNWLDYLEKFGDQLNLDGLISAQEELVDIPLCGLVLSQCDASLKNYLFRHDGLIIACDFENARFRPRGWDFAMTYLSLVQCFPDASEKLLTDLADGFASEHRGALKVDELCAVSKIILIAAARAGRYEKEVKDGG